jgi:sulfite exporter TauE/SafE
MERQLLIALATGASLAVASGAHCVVMCGPLSVAAHGRGGARAGGLYFFGRLVSYTLLGGLAGSVGRTLAAAPWAHWVEAILSWLLAVLLVHAGLRQLGVRPRQPGWVQLGRGPRKNRLGRLLAKLAEEPLLLGAATALLPCGALFAGVTASAALGAPLAGALSMATFAALTGALLVGVAQVGRALTFGVNGRRVLGVLLFAGAAVMAVRPIPMLRKGAVPSCHAALTVELGAHGGRS